MSFKSADVILRMSVIQVKLFCFSEYSTEKARGKFFRGETVLEKTEACMGMNWNYNERGDLYMKKKKILSGLLAGTLCLALILPGTAYADGQKVVTLGADLTQEQKNAVLKYFGVLGQNIQTLTINNQDEREHLGSYVPLEQIGTRTYSCALVSPTSSGGIQVKTANLSWVTSNMIATTLSTSGVVNCDVLAASPFEVSGTGALTGIIMAYESASGVTLDPVKKDLATQELITTGNIANQVGQTQATNIVNEIKIQVIEGQVQKPEEVEEIVQEVVEEVEYEYPELSLTDEDYAMLTGLMTQIAEQQYDYEEMKDTLQRVEDNLQGLNEKVDSIGEDDAEPQEEGPDELQALDEDQEETESETLAPDSILMNTDDTALGEDVTIDATNEEAIQETDPPQTEAPAEEDIFDITITDDYTDQEADPGMTEVPLPDPSMTEAPAVDSSMTEAPLPDPSMTETPVVDPAMTEMPMTDPEVDPFMTEAPVTEMPEAAPLELTGCVQKPFAQDGSSLAAGENQIRLLYGNDNLVPVSGTVTVTDGAGAVTTISLNDAQQVMAVPASEEDKLENGWSGGTEILINMPSMQPWQTYSITVEGVLAQTADPAVLEGVPTAAVNVSWNVTTQGTGAALHTGTVSELTPGGIVSGSVYMDTAAYAEINGYDESKITFDVTQFSPEAAGFYMTCLQPGTASFNVDLYDAEGNYVTSFVREVIIR